MDDQLFFLLATRKLSNEASESDLEKLEKFFEEDDRYKEKYELLEIYWQSKSSVGTNKAKAFQRIKERLDEPVVETDLQNAEIDQPQKSIWRKLLMASKVAAILVFVIAGGYFLFHQNKHLKNPGKEISKEDWMIKGNPRGTKSVIFLSDSTKVILNADSRLRFPQTFRGAFREVYLTGEAFFDVTHNEHRPFIIHAGQMNIKVLGTEFNVKSYPEDSTYETTLIRGLIEVTLNDRPSDKIILRPKEKLVISNTSFPHNISKTNLVPGEQDTRFVIGKMHYVSPEDSAIVETSWVENKLVFENEYFSNLAMDLERKYGVNINFSSEDVKSYRFTGIFEKETIEQALKALRMTEKFDYKIDGKKITIY